MLDSIDYNLGYEKPYRIRFLFTFLDVSSLKMHSFLHMCVLVACIYSTHAASSTTSFQRNLKVPTKGALVQPCLVCHNLVKSFLKAFEETSHQSFAGGDTAWEEKKLGSYENSELRFIEIEEKLCAEVDTGRDQCYHMAELHESELETWFYMKNKNIKLIEFLCINNLKICCPDNTYGPHCIPCPGGIESPCGGHGKCENGGTREEPASCSCDTGYIGDLCDQCSKGFYNSTLTLSCELCDVACKDHCQGPGPQNCEVCSEGYHFVENEGCVEFEALIETRNNSEKKASLESELSNTTIGNIHHSEHSDL